MLMVEYRQVVVSSLREYCYSLSHVLPGVRAKSKPYAARPNLLKLRSG